MIEPESVIPCWRKDWDIDCRIVEMGDGHDGVALEFAFSSQVSRL